MDNPADALLALSNTAAAIADSTTAALEDDRSSSLSELEDAPDNVDLDDDDDLDEDEEVEIEQILPPIPTTNINDGDSEAETERLEDSPDKSKRNAFQISPSKLVQTMTVSDDIRPEIEELTNSDISSPMTPVEDSPLDDLSEAEDIGNPLNLLSQAATVTTKRKRLSDVMDITSDERPRKRRSQSLSDVEDLDSEVESEADKVEVPTREPTAEPDEPQIVTQSERVEPEQAEASASDDSKSKKPEQYTRSRSRRGKDAAEDQENEEIEQDASDDDIEPDDVETVAKTEEEHAKRAAAMDALMVLEKHYATLRDKLYEERVNQVELELSQVTAAQPDHPELLKQFDCVNRHRDEKQDTEQKLLLFKVGALKRKSVAERSTLHSSYFQTVRDVRERHMEAMSEHFYRIQRERFKSSHSTPIYTVPFPQAKIAQVTQQLAYNKEVSILSGLAKYVGFPAAPELAATATSDLDTDLQKMGIDSSASRLRSTGSRPRTTYPNPNTGATSALASSAAAASASSEQQFIESTPWANPNHPIHRLGRQSANKSPFAIDHSYSQSATTPANQQKSNDYTPQPVGSASTIVENPSAQPTPGTDLQSSAMKQETDSIIPHNMSSTLTNGDTVSISPTETRRTISNMLQAGAIASHSHQPPSSEPNSAYVGVNSSPLQARASLLSNLNRTASAAGMRDGTRSPFRADLIASGGMGRFGFR